MAEPALQPRTKTIPFDLAAADRHPGWRGDFAWPLPLAPLQTALVGRQRALLQTIAALPDGEGKRAALLAAGRCLSSASALLEAALLVQAEQAGDFRIDGGPAELDWLRGIGDTPPATPQRMGQPDGASNAMLFRRIARTASWTPAWRLPGAILAPQAVAVTHNAMLREAAADSGLRVSFRHGNALFAAWSEGCAPLPSHAHASTVAEALCAEPALNPVLRHRLAALVRPKVESYLALAAADLAGLARARRLPGQLWSGSGGNYPARALGLEVMHRGGTVIRYDHGGSSGMIANSDPLTLRETSVSTRFVVPTEAVADLCRAQDAASPLPGLAAARIAAGRGEPHLRGAMSLPPRPHAARPRVIYATGALYGFRQLIPPVLRDPIYLDWQIRVAEHLLASPFDTLLKPHPEGIFRGRRHPLADIGPATAERFEAVMAGADVFVFDFALSTAFWTALCSDRPVVFLDLGLAPFDQKIRALLAERCRIVPVRWTGDNLPHISREELADAVSGAARMRPDPVPFRALLAGPGQ